MQQLIKPLREFRHTALIFAFLTLTGHWLADIYDAYLCKEIKSALRSTHFKVLHAIRFEADVISVVVIRKSVFVDYAFQKMTAKKLIYPERRFETENENISCYHFRGKKFTIATVWTAKNTLKFCFKCLQLKNEFGDPHFDYWIVTSTIRCNFVQSLKNIPYCGFRDICSTSSFKDFG